MWRPQRFQVPVMNKLFALCLCFSYGVNAPLRTSFFIMEWAINSLFTAFCQLQRLCNLEGCRRQLWRCSWLAHCTQFNSRSQWWLSCRGVPLISLILSSIIFLLMSMTRTVRPLDTWMHVQLCSCFRVRTETYWWAGDSVINDLLLIKAHNSHKYNYGLTMYTIIY